MDKAGGSNTAQAPERGAPTGGSREPETSPSGGSDPAMTGAADLRTPKRITTALTPDEAVARLAKRSRLGKLPGFEDRGGEPGGLRRFRVQVFGTTFDRELLAVARPNAGGGEIELTPRLLKRVPAIAALLLALTFWPGVWLTDSLLVTYFGWYPREFWVTCAWYLPLCVLSLPAAWAMFRASERAAAAEQEQTLTAIASAVEGELSARPTRA